METMSVVFSGPRKVALEAREIGEPGPGQILVRSLVTLISTGTELTALSGEFPADSAWARYIRYPWVAGYSNVGEVMRTGPGVTSFQVGQRVVSGAPHTQYALVRAADAQLVPEQLSTEVAGFWQLGKTVMNGVRLAQIQMGDAVVIAGAGILPHLAVQYIRHCGGWPVIVVDVAEQRLHSISALRYGATQTITGLVGEEPVSRRILELTQERMADVAFEVTGNPRVIPPLLRLVRRQGRVILLGSPRGPVEIDFHDEVHRMGLHIIGAHVSTHPPVDTPGNPWTAARNGQLFLDWVQAGLLDVEALITHRHPWTSAPEVFTALLADRSKALGVLLDWRS